MRLISAKINVVLVDKARLFIGKNGAKYLDVLLQEVENDQYGNDFRIVQSVSKEERLAGVRGAILGNGKWLGQKAAPQKSAPMNISAPAAASPASDDDVPF